MPVIIEWFDDDHTIIVHKFVGGWTWTEYRAAIPQSYQMWEDGSYYDVDVIADMTESGPLSMQNPFPTLKYLADQTPENSKGTYNLVGVDFSHKNWARPSKKPIVDAGRNSIFMTR